MVIRDERCDEWCEASGVRTASRNDVYTGGAGRGRSAPPAMNPRRSKPDCGAKRTEGRVPTGKTDGVKVKLISMRAGPELLVATI